MIFVYLAVFMLAALGWLVLGAMVIDLLDTRGGEIDQWLSEKHDVFEITVLLLWPLAPVLNYFITRSRAGARDQAKKGGAA